MLKNLRVQKSGLLLLPTKKKIRSIKVKLQKVTKLLESFKLSDTIDQIADQTCNLRLILGERQSFIHEIDFVPYFGSLREITCVGIV